jgi:hypothetical protein
MSVFETIDGILFYVIIMLLVIIGKDSMIIIKGHNFLPNSGYKHDLFLKVMGNKLGPGSFQSSHGL